MAYAGLAASLTTTVTLAQSDAGPEVTPGSGVTPGDAEAIEAAVDAMPLSSSNVLDALSDATRAEVERICLPVQYQSGTVAYRECISEQLHAQPSTSTAIVPMTSLSFDEEYAIQQTCQGAGPVDSAAYRACDEAQLASLAGVPEPSLYRVTEDDTYAVQLGCYESQMNDGVKGYRECLNESIRQLLALPQPDLFALTLVERNALQLRCSKQNTSAVAYRKCLLDAVNDSSVANRTVNSPIDAPDFQNDIEPSTAEFADSPEDLQPVPVSNSEKAAATTPAVDVDPTVTTQAIRLPTTDNLNPKNSIDDSDAQSDTPEEAEGSTQTPADLLARVRTTISGMNDMTQMLMWTAIGLPILLTLFWLLMRGRRSVPDAVASYLDTPITNGVDTAPHRPPSTHQTVMTDDDTAEFARRIQTTRRHDSSALPEDDDDASKFTAQIDELFGVSAPDLATTADEDISMDISRDLDVSVSTRDQETVAEPVSTLLSETTASPGSTPNLSFDIDSDLPRKNTLAPELAAFADLTLAPATARDDYLAWLSVQDEAKQQALAIEFLIYWMAYSDERYAPELKRKIFQLQNPSDHELIKRWTLKQDVHAFAGNLQWLQYNLSTEQHEQIINLLMALLVSENALTPAQNTLLRFLADAFGLGAQRLDALFHAGFAHSMPPLPKLDNPDWWKRQSADSLKRWDARSVSRQRSEIRYRVALGLPLGEELDPPTIMASFKRASKRCQPERFNRLSSREQNLVAKQLEKYEMAAQSLLEVSV